MPAQQQMRRHREIGTFLGTGHLQRSVNGYRRRAPETLRLVSIQRDPCDRHAIILSDADHLDGGLTVRRRSYNYCLRPSRGVAEGCTVTTYGVQHDQ